MNSSASTIRFEGSAPIRQLVLNDFSGVRNSGSLPLSTNYTYNSCAAGGTVSSWAGRASEGYAPGQAITLNATFTHMGSNFSATKVITIPATTTTPTPTATPTPTPTPTPSPTQVGLGGYAVVHPNGKVCGVIVALSSDPFGNGGKMPIEYMGCPIGSRIIFQTTASSTGNVAGWHGENVTYNGSEFLIKSGTSDSSTVQTKIQGGVATDSNGRVWDTGSGAVLKPATTQTDTKTATTTASAPLAVKIAIPDSNAVEVVVASLTTKAKENQLVTNKTSKNQSVVSVNTEFANSLLQITANKKGAKTITLPIQTNSKGDAKLNVKTNLSGYTVSLKAGSETLDSDKVK